MLLTDKDILAALGRDMVIEPFTRDSLTPVGYDLHIGDFVHSLENGVLSPSNGYYDLPPKSTVRALTQESLWVSPRIGGIFHSKVSLVSKGLSHIATTLDPNWYGPLLITFRNNTDKPIRIGEHAEFVTLVMFQAKTPTKSKHHKPPFRSDILTSELESQTKDYVQKVSGILNDSHTLKKFEEAVSNANIPMRSRVSKALRSGVLRRTTRLVGEFVLVSIIGFLVLLNFEWNSLNWLFHDAPYDSSVASALLTSMVLVLVALIELRRSIK